MKSKDIVIEAKNLDRGKKFRIMRMSAWDAAVWAERAISGMVNAGVDILGEIEKAPSVAALADIGMLHLARIERSEREDLGRQLLDGCRLVYNAKGDTREIFPEDIEEALTIFRLKTEAFSLMISHFIGGGGSIST